MAQIPGAQGLGDAIPRPADYRNARVSDDAFGAGLFRAVEGAGAEIHQQELVAQREAKAKALEDVRVAQAERRAADRAQALSVMQHAADAMAVDAEDMQQGVLGGSIDKDRAGEEWGTRSKERITEALKGVPAEHQALVQRDLEHRQAMLGRSVVGKAVRQRNRDDTKSGIDQTLEYAQRLYATDPAGAEQLMAGTVDALGPAAGYGADDIAKTKQAWREKTQFTAGFEAVSAGKNDRKALDRAEQLIKGLPDLDPQRRAQLVDRASAYRYAIDQRAELAAQRAERERERLLRSAEHEFLAFQAMADKGASLDPAYIDRVAQATAGTPYAAAIRGLAEQARVNGGLASQPVQVQRAALDQVNALIAQRGRNPELDKRKDQIEKVLRGSQADLDRDALRAGLERGVITDLKSIDLSGGLLGVVPQLAARVVDAQRVQQWAGRPVSPLTDDEAAAVKHRLDVLPVKERAALVAGISGAIGQQQAQAMAAQMDKQDRALALAFAASGARTTAGRFIGELILLGQQAKADGTSTKGLKEPEVKANAWRARAAADLEGVFANPKFATQVRDAAELIMHGIAAEQGGGLSSNDMERAVRLAVGGTIVEHAGRRIPLPAGIDQDALERRLGAVSNAEIEAQAKGGKVRAGGVEVPVADFVRSLPAQPLMAVRPGEFAVLVGERPVVNAAGDPIIVKVR